MANGRLIGLGYQAQAGKDTIGQMLVDAGWQRFAFADPLKTILAEVNPVINGRGIRVGNMIAEGVSWEGAKEIPEVRELLQRLGVAARNHLHKGVWVQATMRGVDAALKAGTNVVITDMRFPNEADAIAKRDGLVVEVARPGLPEMSHISEQALSDYDFDHVIHNDGTLDDLRWWAQSILSVELGATEPAPPQEVTDEDRA